MPYDAELDGAAGGGLIDWQYPCKEAYIVDKNEYILMISRSCYPDLPSPLTLANCHLRLSQPLKKASMVVSAHQVFNLPWTKVTS